MTSNRGLMRRRFLQAPALVTALGVARAAAAAAAGGSARQARPGSGAAPRKTGLAINVRDFGATGDGTTKDTGAIQPTKLPDAVTAPNQPYQLR